MIWPSYYPRFLFVIVNRAEKLFDISSKTFPVTYILFRISPLLLTQGFSMLYKHQAEKKTCRKKYKQSHTLEVSKRWKKQKVVRRKCRVSLTKFLHDFLWARHFLDVTFSVFKVFDIVCYANSSRPGLSLNMIVRKVSSLTFLVWRKKVD